MSRSRGRRSFAVRLLHSIARIMRILLLAFAGLGPAPPRLPPPGPDPTEQASDARPRVPKRR